MSIYHIRILITGQEFNLNWFQFDVVTGENEFQDKPILIYPNPTSGIIHLKNVHRLNRQPWKYDLSGRLIDSMKEQTMDISHLNEGIYIGKVINGSQVFKTRL